VLEVNSLLLLEDITLPSRAVVEIELLWVYEMNPEIEVSHIIKVFVVGVSYLCSYMRVCTEVAHM
jgi:hypothetical protein